MTAFNQMPREGRYMHSMKLTKIALQAIACHRPLLSARPGQSNQSR
jgi:hypothetical protein